MDHEDRSYIHVYLVEDKRARPLSFVMPSDNFTLDGTHTLIMHFGEREVQENDFNEDSSFLDILNLCKKFIDIYSVGIKVTDGHGRPLRNDKDVMAMLKEHEVIPCIHVYLEEDKKARPLNFMMPSDNSTLGGTHTLILHFGEKEVQEND